MPVPGVSDGRRRNMAAIRSTDTGIEMLVRRGLHRRGFRFRLHAKDLPGRPDVVLPRYRVVVEVRGCFFHKHECATFKWPKTREEFWRAKLTANATRDLTNQARLTEAGWRVAVIWGCAVGADADAVVDQLAAWITSDERKLGISS